MSAEEHWKKTIKHEQEAKLDNLKQHISNMAKAAADMAREAADALQAAAAMEDALDPLGWSERDAKVREEDYWFWREGAAARIQGLVLIVVAPPVGETMGRMAVSVGMESVSE